LAALLIKESVNQTQDNQGFYNALNACFSMHQMNHSHWAEIHDDKFAIGKPEDGVVSWKEAPPVVLTAKDVVRADN
ncbi:MAG: enoyl-CoA hydratase, partial [Acidimicrobiia bacterium]